MLAMLILFKDLMITALSARDIPTLPTFAVHIPIGAVPAEFPFTRTSAYPSALIDPGSSESISLIYPSSAVLAADEVFRVDFPD
jgi:hypothetical protein